MKDPAILFYPADFIIGTMFFTDEQTGKYIRLLCYQQQMGGIINKENFEKVVNGDNAIREKFIETEEGWYNLRLWEEAEKRSKFVNSRRKNLMGGHKEGHTAPRVVNVNVNRNEDVSINEIIDNARHFLQDFIQTECPHISKLGKQLTFAEASRLVDEFQTSELQAVIEGMENYKQLTKKYTSVNLTIRNWIRRDKENGKNRSQGPRGTIDFEKWNRELAASGGAKAGPEMAAVRIAGRF